MLSHVVPAFFTTNLYMKDIFNKNGLGAVYPNAPDTIILKWTNVFLSYLEEEWRIFHSQSFLKQIQSDWLGAATRNKYDKFTTALGSLAYIVYWVTWDHTSSLEQRNKNIEDLLEDIFKSLNEYGFNPQTIYFFNEIKRFTDTLLELETNPLYEVDLENKILCSFISCFNVSFSNPYFSRSIEAWCSEYIALGVPTKEADQKISDYLVSISHGDNKPYPEEFKPWHMINDTTKNKIDNWINLHSSSEGVLI